MLRLLGYLLIIVGAGVGGYVGLVDLSFSAVYLMGFVGTAGREAGGELATMLMLTFGVIIVSWPVIRLGSNSNHTLRGSLKAVRMRLKQA